MNFTGPEWTPVDFRIRYGPRTWKQRLLSWPWRPWCPARITLEMSTSELNSVEFNLTNQIVEADERFRSGQKVQLKMEGMLK